MFYQIQTRQKLAFYKLHLHIDMKGHLFSRLHFSRKIQQVDRRHLIFRNVTLDNQILAKSDETYQSLDKTK